MSYVNDYSRELSKENEEISGQVMSHPSVTKTLYMQAWLPKQGTEFPGRLRVRRGDPVVMMQGNQNSECGHAANGRIIAFDGKYAASYVGYGETAIVGVALADAEYTTKNVDTEEEYSVSEPIPVIVAGDVTTTVYAAPIRARGGVDFGARGDYFAGEYVSANGVASSDTTVWKAGSQLVIGQILASKTDANTATRLYKRFETDQATMRNYYHIPIRLTIGPATGEQNQADPETTKTATNIGDDVEAQAVVSVYYSTANSHWEINGARKNGELANGIAVDKIKKNNTGKVLVRGMVTYTWNAILDKIAASPRARSSAFGVRALIAAATNDEPPMDAYYVGQRVTGDITPVETGVAGNQYGTVVAVDTTAGELTVSLDAVPTHAPANTAEAVVESGSLPTTTPVGTALIQNPITGDLVPCRYDTDNVDAVLRPAVQLPTVNGWTLADYRAIYGDGVYMDEFGSFWTCIKSFAKGVYERVLKPVATWAIGIAAPVAGSYVGPLGQVLASAVSTKCGQLLEAVGGTPPANGGYTYMTIYGQQLQDDNTTQVYTDNSASYADSHPNSPIVCEIDTPTANTWVIGDCFGINTTTGKAEKITDYTTPIAGVLNWAPAQDPVTNGWKVAGIARGFREIRTAAPLPIGTPVLRDGTSAVTRLSQGLATAIMGYVREVWQPSSSVLAAVAAGKLPGNEATPNMIVEVNPQYFTATQQQDAAAHFTATYTDYEDVDASDEEKEARK